MEHIVRFTTKFGYIFYLMNPKDHMYEKVEDVPDYYKEVTPVFIFVLVLEQILLLYHRRSLSRFNDSITNICQGMLVEIFKIPLRGIELLLYTWVYNNYRVTTLPWNSVWTWIFCLVATDFCFYWMHRATHQISILWTFHEPHHSSEEFNMTVPMRLSVVTSATLWLTYVPLALAVPPSVYFVHYQMNIIYQYWLHSEFVPPLWIVELIFVTPTHHRVHHGRNRRCIDKNFGGYLIIWDRLFGTFEAYDDPAEIVFGVVHPLKSFSPVMIQTNNLQNMWKKFWQVKGIWNKFSAIFKGPGWSPGTPWIGNIEDIPEPSKDEVKYNPHLPFGIRIYVAIHLLTLASGYLQFILNLKILSSGIFMWCMAFIFYSTMAFGAIFDRSTKVPIVETVRCLHYFIIDFTIGKEVMNLHPGTWILFWFYRCVFLSTLSFWIADSMKKLGCKIQKVS